jgi:hypothetical protein
MLRRAIIHKSDDAAAELDFVSEESGDSLMDFLSSGTLHERLVDMEKLLDLYCVASLYEVHGLKDLLQPRIQHTLTLHPAGPESDVLQRACAWYTLEDEWLDQLIIELCRRAMLSLEFDNVDEEVASMSEMNRTKKLLVHEALLMSLDKSEPGHTDMPTKATGACEEQKYVVNYDWNF